MLQEYVPLLLLIAFVVLNAAGMIGLSHLVTRARPTAVKRTPYESGMPPLGDTRDRFSVKFYMVAMMFIVFDIETVFMLPWGVAFRQLGFFGLVVAPVSRSLPSTSVQFTNGRLEVTITLVRS